MKAREWLKRGVETLDPVDKLSNLWRGFNNLFAPENGGSERNKIKNFLNGNITEDLATEIINECNNDVVYLLSKSVIDMRGNGKDTQRDINAFEATESGIEKLKAVFMVVYQVWCNLEHGQKSPKSERDNLLCLHSSNLVKKVLEKCT